LSWFRRPKKTAEKKVHDTATETASKCCHEKNPSGVRSKFQVKYSVQNAMKNAFFRPFHHRSSGNGNPILSKKAPRDNTDQRHSCGSFVKNAFVLPKVYGQDRHPGEECFSLHSSDTNFQSITVRERHRHPECPKGL
jgi:hypothetical protein